MTHQQHSDERLEIERVQNGAKVRSLASRWLLNSLLAVSFLGPVACLVWVVWHHNRFQGDLTRFLFCTAISECLAVLCFLLYPAEYSTKPFIPILGAKAQVVGPVVIFLVCLPTVWYFMPKVGSGDLLKANYDTGVSKLSWQNLTIESDDTFDWYFVVDKADPLFLYGVYVKFDGRSKYSAKLVSEFRRPYPVEFVRGDDNFAVK